MTEQEMDRWLLACAVDPSIVTPHEMGYRPDGTPRFPTVSTFSLDECIGNPDDATHCVCFTDGDACCYCGEQPPPPDDDEGE